MLWFEPFILWLVRRLLAPTPATAVVREPIAALCTRFYPAPVACPALLRHTRWARFQCPPKRPRPCHH